MTELTFDRAGYVDLLRKLIGENRNLQNNPPTNIPQEDLASDHVLRTLEPFTTGKYGKIGTSITINRTQNIVQSVLGPDHPHLVHWYVFDKFST
jgi:hypothetical protein